MKKIGVIGAGSWGTALAQTLAGKGHAVRIWDLDVGHVKEMQKNRENVRYLPGAKFFENLEAVTTLEEDLDGVEVVLFAAPAQHFRSALQSALPLMNKEMMVINVAKGIEQKTLKRMSEIAEELLGKDFVDERYVALSGPSHAEEVGMQMPTTVSVASRNIETARAAQDIFMTNRFRIYTTTDVTGLELGGALKNIIALGAGIADGMGFGDNAKAAMMTRGMTEITRLGVKLGAEAQTFAGLAGIGDLIVTCTSMHSRNRRCGILIGEGVSPQEATEKIGMVVEGMFTTEAAYSLAEQVGVEMPITECIYNVINGKLGPEEAVEILMAREKKDEAEKHGCKCEG